MSTETAELVFFVIAGAMWAIWLAGTAFALSRARPARRADYSGGYVPEEEVADAVTGEAEIAGECEALSKKIAEQLVAAASAGGAHLVKITERTSERIAFECVPGAGGRAGVFDSGVMTLKAEGGRVRVRYAVSLKRFSSIMRLVTYLVCFAYGGIFVVGAPILLWMFVVRGENETARWQVFQTFQMAHGVWPPFLVGFLNSHLRKMTVRFFETLLANVEHVA